MTPDELRALHDFQRHSAEGLEPGVEGETIGLETARALRAHEATRVRMPSVHYRSAHDHDRAMNRALSREPNVYVRRARRQLGLRPTGFVYHEDLQRLPPACRRAVDVVALRASQSLPPRRSGLSGFTLLLMAGAALYNLAVAGWGRR